MALSIGASTRSITEVVTQYNIVPGLMGVILTMTMVMITGLAITRERERGTMENLLSMPTRPSEVLIGKIVPYIFVGYIQVSVILIAADFLFHVPMQGSILRLLLVARVHHRESGDGNHLLHHRQKPAAGGADGFLRFSPVDFALRIHVSVSRHATLGPNGRRSFSSHPFSAHRPRHFLKGEWHRRHHASALADRALCLIVLAIGIKRYRQTLD